MLRPLCLLTTLLASSSVHVRAEAAAPQRRPRPPLASQAHIPSHTPSRLEPQRRPRPPLASQAHAASHTPSRTPSRLEPRRRPRPPLASQTHTHARARSRLEPYRLHRASACTTGCLGANLFGFVLTTARPDLFSRLVKDNDLIRRGQLYRLFSSCWLHAGPAHLAINMYALSQLGPEIETWFGPRRFIATYLLSGVAGNLLSYAVARAPRSVGASGAVFGLVGSYCVFLMRNQRVLQAKGVRGIDQVLQGLTQTCAMNALIGMSPGSRIDNMGHLGGFLGGAACAYLIGPRLVARRADRRLYDDPVLRLPGS